MNDVERMKESQSYYELLADVGSFILTEKVSLFDVIKEICSLYKLRDDVKMSFCLNALLELQQKRMTYYLHYAAFVTEL